jgi:hypothetical protein
MKEIERLTEALKNHGVNVVYDDLSFYDFEAKCVHINMHAPSCIEELAHEATHAAQFLFAGGKPLGCFPPHMGGQLEWEKAREWYATMDDFDFFDIEREAYYVHTSMGYTKKLIKMLESYSPISYIWVKRLAVVLMAVNSLLPLIPTPPTPTPTPTPYQHCTPAEVDMGDC